MNSHSVLSCFPLRGHGTAVCKISQWVKRQQSGAKVKKKGPTAKRVMQLAGSSRFLRQDFFFLGSFCHAHGSKNKGRINLSARWGVRWLNIHCLTFPIFSSGRRNVFLDRKAQLKDLKLIMCLHFSSEISQLPSEDEQSNTVWSSWLPVLLYKVCIIIIMSHRTHMRIVQVIPWIQWVCWAFAHTQQTVYSSENED